MIAFSLSPAQINSLRDDFNAMDTNRNGTISLSEIRESIKNCKGIPADAIERHCEQSGLNNDEPINYNEFIAAAMCKRISIDEERLHMAFELADTTNSGFISSETVRKMLGEEVEEETIKV